MLVMIDNYDSFTYNLVQYLLVLKQDVRVFRNDETSVDDVLAMNPDHVVISPGAGTPDEDCMSVDLIASLAGRTPLLGVCLGHHCITVAYGGRIHKAKILMHGKVSSIEHNGAGVFRGLKSPLKATRYHSLAADPASIPDCLEVTARSEDGEIMGVQHRQHPVIGVQFHPESILTTRGKRLLSNFVQMEKGA